MSIFFTHATFVSATKRLVIAAASATLALATLSLPTGCEPTPISELSPDDGIQRIREHHADERWENVINDVNEYRSRYPYSQFATEAQLLQTDAYFQSGRYAEAIAGYEEFLQKNVNHPKRALAAFRIAKSYDLQSSEAIDREQDFSKKALDKYLVYLEGFAKENNAAEARERVAILRRRLAEHDRFVARFYWKKDLFHSALSRYLEILDKHQGFDDIRTEALERSIQAYEQLAQQLEKDPKSDLVVYYKGSTPADLRKRAQDLRSSSSKTK